MAVEKTEEELRKEINELLHQQREITERLRDPRGLRRGGTFTALAPRNGARQRPFLSHGERIESEDQPPAKRRLSSAIVKAAIADDVVVGVTTILQLHQVEDGELVQDDDVAVNTNGIVTASHSDSRPFHPLNRTSRMDSDIPPAKHVPRVLPKNEDSRSVNRNKRMLGQLLGTLEKFRKEDMQLSGTEAYMRRSNSLQRAEQRAREESERLRIEEREQIAEKRKRDLTLRARVAAKTEEKKLELLFLQWSEHHKKLSNFIRTTAEPPIYYLPKKPWDDESAASSAKSKEEAFLEWKNARREELSEYQKQIDEQYLANVEKDMERWQNARKARKGNNDQDLQESMDKELDTHRLEHGPKKRKIPGGSNNEDDDVEDINVGEDDMMDDVLEDDSGRRVDETSVAEAGNSMADSAAHSDNVDLK